MNEIAVLRQEIRALTDRAEIVELVTRFLRSLDERAFDARWAERTFAPDIELHYPVGSFHGLANMVELHIATLNLFGPTQHLSGNHLVELDGDQATVRWDGVQSHVHLAATQQLRADPPGERFVSGGWYQAEVVRLDGRWRFRRIELHVTWKQGKPPVVTEEIGAVLGRLRA
ncbi:nuclear transport factor 2 family protein [Crossiella sp. SN42]|uniref:nuclear transport factor 2 family protein n=1 Tax=Crossiella sp. SN42 TaxID=2944808 RepID=UPI00207D5DD9|nr:nuclear transport factor 2 family protein [Crossiella sp. SN42]MCO1581820.1 nuclear transport factor 2 family protein [Crossiella sp. SN42]